MAVIRKWRALDTELPYENRDKLSDLRCGSLIVDRLNGSQTGYGTLDGNWDWYVDREDVYGFTFTARMLEEWIDAVGPDVARKYYGPDNWRSYDSYADVGAMVFQLLGQDYLDGKYNGDITTHDRVNVLRFEGYRYGVEWSQFQGTDTNDIINTQLTGLRGDPTTAWDVREVNMLSEYYFAANSIYDQKQRWEIFVVYETAPGSEYFFWVANDSAGPTIETELGLRADTPDNIGAFTAAYRPTAAFGFFRIQDLDNDQPMARGNDSGWAIINQYDSASKLPCVPINQDIWDKALYTDITGPPGPISGVYQAPFGYDSSADYNYQDLSLNELMGNGPAGTANRALAGTSAFGTIPCLEARVGTLHTGWGPYGRSLIKNHPLYTPLGKKLGKMPESLLISGIPYQLARNKPSQKAFKMINGVKYLMIPPGLAIKAE